MSTILVAIGAGIAVLTGIGAGLGIGWHSFLLIRMLIEPLLRPLRHFAPALPYQNR